MRRLWRALRRLLQRRRRVCSWCGRTLSRGVVPFLRASHGICPSCEVEYGE